jgi:hypothetical protein
MEIDTHISVMALAAQREDALLRVIGRLVQELHPQRAKAVNVSRSSRLERDLGIDSLARTKCRDRTFCAACDGITRMPLAFADEALNELLDLAYGRSRMLRKNSRRLQRRQPNYHILGILRVFSPSIARSLLPS